MAKIDMHIETIKTMAADGKDLKTIGAAIGFSSNYVGKYMKARGIELKKVDTWKQIQLELDQYYDTIVELAKDMTISELAEKFEISYQHMWRYIDLNDIKYKPAPKGGAARVKVSV